MRKGQLVSVAILVAFATTGCVPTGKLHPCNPIAGATAVCLNGTPLPMTATVIKQRTQYYAPADELGAVLNANVVISPDKKLVTVNGKNLSMTNGATNTLERDGRVYILIMDAAQAAGGGVAIDFVRDTVNIIRVSSHRST